MALEIGCATIPNGTVCSTAGVLSAGADCAETLSPKTSELTLDEYIDFLSPQEQRTCVPVQGMSVCRGDQSAGEPVKLKARGGALCQSAEDWNELKTALEVACKKIKCRREVTDALARVSKLTGGRP